MRPEISSIVYSSLSQKKRAEVVDLVQGTWDEEIQVTRGLDAKGYCLFLATTGTMAVGLTLTAARITIKLDVAFLGSDDKQVMKRSHRIGQDKECYVFRCVTVDVPEDAACRARQEHRSLFAEEAYAEDPEGEGDSSDNDGSHVD
jgi:hypothetical protein